VRSHGKASLTISAKSDGLGAAWQPWVLGGERSGLQTRIATTESVTLCMLIKSRLRFWNWKGQFEAAPCEPSFLFGCILEGNVQKETVVRS
jgi:hypothetical protein